MNRLPNYNLAKQKAQEILRDKGYVEPPVSPLEIATGFGLNVYTIDMPNKYSNVAGYIDFEQNAIFTNSADPITRQMFTVAHELGHYILHKDELIQNPSEYSILYRTNLLSNKSPLEQEVDCFAAHLLVPFHMLKQYKNFPDSVLATLFRVSREVIRNRLNALV